MTNESNRSFGIAGAIQGLLFEFKIRPTIKLFSVSKRRSIRRSSYIPVETQNFAKDQDKNHSNVDAGLLHIRANALRHSLETCIKYA